MEEKNWIVRNKTWIFGGGEIWQPDCNKTRAEILSGFVTKPEEFLPKGKCFDRTVGKVFHDECTSLLQEGVAFVKNKNLLQIGLGSGALLGGMDKELTWIPVNEPKCKEAESLDKKRNEMEDWDLSKKIPEGVYFAPSDLKSLEECKKYKEDIEKIDKPILDTIRKYPEILQGRVGNQSPSGISAKLPTERDLSPFKISDSIEEIVEKGATTPETVKSELKYWGKKMSDIKKVYHNTETPFVIETKDGQRFIIAPRITPKSDECYGTESHIKFELRNKAKGLNEQILNLAHERLTEVTG